MSRSVINDETLDGLADTVSALDGGPKKMTLTEMKERIARLGGGGEDEATQSVFVAFARMDGYEVADEKSVLDVGIEKLSQLLGEDVAA